MGASIDDVNAVRSGRGEHKFDPYVWGDHENICVISRHDDEDTGL